MKKVKPLFILLTILLFTFLVSKYCYQLCLIHGKSMEPTYHSWQLTLIDKRADAPKAGTVVAVRCNALNAVIVKRVVAVPGDSLIIKDGILYVNGTKSTAISPAAYYQNAGIAANIIHLKESEYFLLGDNCAESIDSRSESVGVISASDILDTIIPQRVAQ